MRTLLGILLIFFFQDVSNVKSESEFNEVDGANCHIADLIEWGYDQTSEKWLDITKRHSFTDFCQSVNVLVKNLAGCVNLFAQVVQLADNTVNFDPLYQFYDYLAVVQHYCSIARFSKMCTEATAVWGCAVATVGTVQTRITGTFDDLSNVCVYYNNIVELFEICANSSMADCTDDQKTTLYAGMLTTLNYFKTGQEYCLDGCGEAVALIASKLPGCEYVIDYSTHEWDKYCEYMHTGLECIYQVWNACPVVPGVTGPVTAKYRDEVIIYADLLGCKIQLDNSTIKNIESSISMPDCVYKSITCVKRVSAFFGLTTDNTQWGGYSVSKAGALMEKYAQQLIYSKSFYEICDFINDAVWDMFADCTHDIVTGCSDYTSGNAGFETDVIINGYIGKYLDQACAKGCTDLVDAIANIEICTAGLTFKGITVEKLMIDLITKILFTVGDEIQFCKAIFGYVACVLPDFMKCDVIYQNWIELISMTSDVKWSIAFCNIEIDLETGEFILLRNKYNGWFKLSKKSGSSSVKSSAVLLSLVLLLLTRIFHLQL